MTVIANGSIVAIENISPCNTQFTTNPSIRIITDTGSGANVFPVVEYRPQYLVDNQSLVGIGSIKTVIDCVGVRDMVFVGWVNGFPYFGPYHEHEGKRMVGPIHTDTPHPTIYDTKEQSLFAMNVTPNQAASGDVTSTLTPLSGYTTTPTPQSSTPTASSAAAPTPSPAPAPTPTPAPTPDPTPPPSSPPPSSPPPSPPPSNPPPSPPPSGGGGGGYGY